MIDQQRARPCALGHRLDCQHKARSGSLGRIGKPVNASDVVLDALVKRGLLWREFQQTVINLPLSNPRLQSTFAVIAPKQLTRRRFVCRRSLASRQAALSAVRRAKSMRRWSKRAKAWAMVDMKADWRRVFPF